MRKFRYFDSYMDEPEVFSYDELTELLKEKIAHLKFKGNDVLDKLCEEALYYLERGLFMFHKIEDDEDGRRLFFLLDFVQFMEVFDNLPNGD